MKTAIYVRVSTDTQDYNQQIEACRRYCEIKGWDSEVFQETMSSTKERPVWNQVLLKAREEKGRKSYPQTKGKGKVGLIFFTS